MNAPSQIVVSLLSGRSHQREVVFQRGIPVPLLLVGSKSTWQVDGMGAASSHIALGFNGTDLFVAAPNGAYVHVNGRGIGGQGWVAVQRGTLMIAGAARFLVQERSLERVASARSELAVTRISDEHSAVTRVSDEYSAVTRVSDEHSAITTVPEDAREELTEAPSGHTRLATPTPSKVRSAPPAIPAAWTARGGHTLIPTAAHAPLTQAPLTQAPLDETSIPSTRLAPPIRRSTSSVGAMNVWPSARAAFDAAPIAAQAYPAVSRLPVDQFGRVCILRSPPPAGPMTPHAVAAAETTNVRPRKTAFDPVLVWRNTPKLKKATCIVVLSVLGATLISTRTPAATKTQRATQTVAVKAPTTADAGAPSLPVCAPAAPNKPEPQAKPDVPVPPSPSPPSSPTATGRAAALSKDRTPERHALDSAAAGDYAAASEQYAALARQHPDNPALAEAARISASKVR